MIRSLFVALCLALALGAASPAAAQTTSQSPTDIVARVGDQEITLAEVEQKWRESDAGSFLRVTQDRYDALHRFLDEVIGDRLLAIEARARGISVDELLQQELPGRIEPITDAEIEATHTRLSSQMQGRSLDEMREPIRNFLQQQRPIEARAALVDELEARLDLPVRISLDPPRQQVAVAPTDPVKGPASASVEIIEFSDFQ